MVVVVGLGDMLIVGLGAGVGFEWLLGIVFVIGVGIGWVSCWNDGVHFCMILEICDLVGRIY